MLSTENLLGFWSPQMRERENEMLRLLVAAHPGGMTEAELAERMNLKAFSEAFTGYLATLRKNGLVTVTSGTIYASDALFPAPGEGSSQQIHPFEEEPHP